MFKSYMKTVGGGEGDRCNYPTRIDMYGRGCEHDCQYCYAKSLLSFRNMWHPEHPMPADRRRVQKVLDSIPTGKIVRLGGMTDPFQPIESKYHCTEWLISELNKRRIGYLIVTKSSTVADCRILHPQLAHIQISYTYTEGYAPSNYEHASPPESRLKAAETLFDRGYDVQLRISPYVPQFIDLNKVLESPVDKVLVEFLRVNAFIKRNMPYMDFSDWSENDGNYQHLPLSKKRELLQPFIDSGKRITVCEDNNLHYQYFREKVNANPEDCCDLRT